MENKIDKKIILITGGSRSGKSEFAEEILKNKENALYIATAKVTDKEMKKRIYKHKIRRPSTWKTYEGYQNLHNIIPNYKEKYILLDCVTIMVTNLMFSYNLNLETASDDELDEVLNYIKVEFNKLINAAKKENKTLIMVTNEVGYGIVPSYKLGRIFRDFAGDINKLIASVSDEVYLVTCGIPLKIK